MNQPEESIALFGGSFDPVHLGHLAVARAAAERFQLARVYFVPACLQPLKTQQQATSFEHRFAMLTLALQGERNFYPSLLESPETVHACGQQASYSADTVPRMRKQMKPGTRLYFLIGMDAFAHIPKWRRPVELLRSVEFIVASRPGFPLDQVTHALPIKLRPEAAEEKQLLSTGTLESKGVRLRLLPDVHHEVSATAIRDAARRGVGLENLVPGAVAEYILKMKLYTEGERFL